MIIYTCVFVYVCVFTCIWKQKPGMKMIGFRLVVTTAKNGGSQDHNHSWEGTLPSETPMESHFSPTFLSLGWVVERGQSHISSGQAWNEEFQAASGLSIQLYWNFSWMAHVPRSPQGNLYLAQGYADTLWPFTAWSLQLPVQGLTSWLCSCSEGGITVSVSSYGIQAHFPRTLVPCWNSFSNKASGHISVYNT